MHTSLEFFNCKNALSDAERRLIAECVDNALSISRSLLPGPRQIKVEVSVGSGNTKRVPIQGLVLENGMMIFIDPKQPVYRTREGQEQIASTVAHEWHHIVRNSGVGCGRSIGNRLVSEGLALNFEQEVVGEIPYLATAVPVKRLLVHTKSIINTIRKTGADARYSVFVKDRDKGYPDWLGYSLGYQIVTPWLKSTGKSAAECVNVRGRKILLPWLRQEISAQGQRRPKIKESSYA